MQMLKELDKKQISAIRAVMGKTGWDHYEAITRLEALKAEKGIPFMLLAKADIWRDYKSGCADKIAAYMNGQGAAPALPEQIDRERIDNMFFSERQKRAIQQIKSGVITFQTIADYLQVDIPDELLKREDNLVGKIAFRPTHCKPDGVFFCVEKKYVNPERVKKQKPLCIIGYPKAEAAFAETGVPFVPCRYIGTYVLDMSHLWRKNFDAKVIGISGSVGKTSTSDMVGRVTGAGKRMYKIEGNQNTTWQISGIVYNLKPEHEVYLQEASGSFLGQLERSSRILEPDIFIITNIKNVHLEKYDGRKEFLLYEKTALDRHAAPGAIGVINWDDPLLKKAPYQHKIVSYAMEDPNADFYSDSIVEKDGQVLFDVLEKDGRRTPVVLNAVGLHNVSNALAAFAVGVALGIDRETIVKAIATYKTSGVRQNLTWLGGQHVYLDCYNASEDSIKGILRTMGTIGVAEGKRKIAVLGDVLELGAISEESHRRIGQAVAELGTVDEAFFYGPESRFAYEECAKAGVPCRHTTDSAELIRWIKEDTKDQDLLCYKASHGMKFSYVLDEVYGTDYYLVDETTINAKSATDSGLSFKVVEDYGCSVTGVKQSEATMSIPTKIGDVPVRTIGRGAFKNARAAEIYLPSSVECIAQGAFENAKTLKEIVLPGAKYIGDRAFANCKELTSAAIAEGCLHIGEQAFADCPALRVIAIPDSIRQIEENAFDGSEQVSIICGKDSYAAAYAARHGIACSHDMGKVAALCAKAAEAVQRKKEADEAQKKEKAAQEAESNQPETPYGTKISAITKEGIEFYWKKLERADGYEVFRSYSPDGSFEKIAKIESRRVGTYLDIEFDHSKKEVYYTVRSFMNQPDGSVTYSDMIEPKAATYRDDLLLERKETYMYSGTTRTMRAFIGWGEPEDAQWSSDNEAVATVAADGTITAVSSGRCNITCATKAYQQSATTDVIVDRKACEPLGEITARYHFNAASGCWEQNTPADTNDAVIMMVGDMMCGKKQMETQWSEVEGWNFNDSYEYCRGIMRSADLAVGNLETLLAAGWPYMLDETYINNMNNCNATSRYLDAVKYGRFDALVMANNHNCDGGTRALLETIDQVDRYQFARTGAFKSAEEPRFFIANVNGIKVGYLAYMTKATGFNGKDSDWSKDEKDSLLNIFTPEKAAQDIAACRAAGAEYIIAYMHWGLKNYRKPTKAQIKEAQEIVDAGADYVIGANPHVLQMYDVLVSKDGRKVPCFYSVGNFQSIMRQIPENPDSVIVRIRLQRNADGKVILAENNYIPCHTYLKRNGHRWAPVAVCNSFNKLVRKPKQTEFYDRIIGIIGNKIESM